MPRGLIYFADPMCSWCWGFSDVIKKIADDFSDQLPIRVMMGGLYAGAGTPLDEKGKADIREHWRHVAELSGAEFDFSFFEREQFIYNTEPACRAIVLVQQHEPAVTLTFLRHVQNAFYKENRDITDPAILSEEAAKFGFNPEKFSGLFEQAELIAETRKHFAITRQLGVSGFPTLFAVDDWGREKISTGYQSAEALTVKLTEWLNKSRNKESEA